MTRPSDVLPSPRRRRGLLWGAGLLLAPVWPGPAAQPADAPAARLRLRLERDARRLEVGQAIVVRLEVWVSTWFQAAVEFPTMLVAEGALVEVVGGSPDSRFEDQGGRRWTGLIRRYRILPVQPGELSVGLAAPLRVQPGGGNGRPQALKPPAPLRLNVRLPAGAEDIQPFVAARRLELRQRWWPEATADAAPPQVGDLVRREVVLVTDSTSPLLPAPDFGAPAGVQLRVQAAQVHEQRAHAAATPTLTRRHEAVYTLQQTGRAELPAVEIVWWDLARRKRRVTRLAGLALDVRPATARADPFAQASSAAASKAGVDTPAGPSRGAWALAAAGALGAVIAGLVATRERRVRPGAFWLPQTGHAAARRAWSGLHAACRRHDAPAASQALGRVWSSLPPDTRRRWQDDTALAEARDALSRHRHGPAQTGAGPWRGDALWQALRQLKRAEADRRRAPSLPALHP